MSASRELADLVSESPSTDLNLDNNTLFVDVSENRVGIGTTTPESKLDIKVGSAGSVTAHTEADDIILESNTVAGISILTPDTASSRLVFGSPSSNFGAAVFYRQNINKMNVGTLQSGGALALRSGADVDALYIDENQNVGIGTTNPSFALEVSGNTDILQLIGTGTGGPQLRLTDTSDSSDGDNFGYLDFSAKDSIDAQSIFNRISNVIVDDTNTTEDTRLTISAMSAGTLTETLSVVSGKVGIGTTDPGGLLGIYKSGANADMVIHNLKSASGSRHISAINFLSQNSDNYASWSTWTSTDSAPSFNISYDADTDSIGTTPYLTIKDNGNVGIGTTGPSYNLVVKATTDPRIKLEEDAGGGNHFQSHWLIESAANTRIPSSVAGDTIFAANSGRSIHFAEIDDDTQGVTNMTISAAGNVGIGTTSPVGDFQIGSNGIMTHFFSGTISASGSVTHTMTQNSTGGPYYGHYMYTGFIFFQGWTNGAQNNGNRSEVLPFAIAQASFSIGSAIAAASAGSYGGHSFSTATTNGNPALGISNSNGSYPLEYKLTWMFATQGYTPSSWA